MGNLSSSLGLKLQAVEVVALGQRWEMPNVIESRPSSFCSLIELLHLAIAQLMNLTRFPRVEDRPVDDCTVGEERMAKGGSEGSESACV